MVFIGIFTSWQRARRRGPVDAYINSSRVMTVSHTLGVIARMTGTTTPNMERHLLCTVASGCSLFDCA